MIFSFLRRIKPPVTASFKNIPLPLQKSKLKSLQIYFSFPGNRVAWMITILPVENDMVRKNEIRKYWFISPLKETTAEGYMTQSLNLFIDFSIFNMCLS